MRIGIDAHPLIKQPKNSMMPLVTIITINYKNYLDTIECLASVFKIDYYPYQIIVIDNNSSDDSFARIKKWLKAQERINLNWNSFNMGETAELSKPASFISYSFNGTEFIEDDKQLLDDGNDKIEGKNIVTSPLILIKSDNNLGYSGANNLGIKFALHNNPPDFFWFLNNDTVVEKNALSALIETINKDQKIGLVGSKLLYYYNPDYIQYLAGGKIKYNYATFPYQDGRDFSSDDIEIKGYITGASFLIKREILDKAGLWDENFFMSVEDVEYSFRIHKAGYKLYACSGSRVYHKDGASTKIKKKTRYFLGWKTKRVSFNSSHMPGYYDLRNWLYFGRKHRTLISKIFYYYFFVPSFFLAVIIFIIVFDDRKWDRIKLAARAFKDGLTNKLGPLTTAAAKKTFFNALPQ